MQVLYSPTSSGEYIRDGISGGPEVDGLFRRKVVQEDEDGDFAGSGSD